ncbi:MAG: GAF domain-containing sensor histidine kinase [Sphingobacteriia bacterium]|nr:MAG: GAF domain-containing sensor histidine kinase [Sphingobacteriia bacterium]TAH09322.1 MAG: GAF domain-containing sensor histidine kinase [Sphingobacteriia bacterium]
MVVIVPENESSRLPQLYQISVFDSQPEEAFDEIVEVASRICNLPFSSIVLVDGEKLWLKAKKGIIEDQLGQQNNFFEQTILGNEVLEIIDIQLDERFIQNSLVINPPYIRFYAGVPLITNSGDKLGTLSVMDIAPRKLTEDQIFALGILAKQVIRLFDIRLHNQEIKAQNTIVESQKKHLEELSEIQNKIISIVAHDVRSPVASLKKVLELKKEGAISLEKMDDFLAMVAKQMDGTINLLTNLVDWGSILLNKSSAKFSNLNLYELVTTKLKNLEVASLVKHNQLVNNIPRNCKVFTDENMLKFILRNLINNAIKFTEGGIISINSSIELNKVSIMVSDTGVGMNDDVKKSLFNTDRRSTRKGTNKEEGSGLGLILAKEFAEILGSQLLVSSEFGKGTSISFELPITTESN